MNPQMELEVRSNVRLLKREKAFGPDKRTVRALTTLLRYIWNLFRCRWMIAPVFEKGTCNDFINHHEISSTPIVAKVLDSLLPRHLTPIRKTDVRKHQAAFRHS